MEKSIQIVVVVVVILATALIIMIIFNKGMGDWMSIFGDWGANAADESTCRQACIRSCSKSDTGTGNYNDIASGDLKGKKDCQTLVGDCKCTFGITP